MVLELDIGIICGCLSGVKPVMTVLFPALFGSSQHSQNGEGTRMTGYGRPNTHQSFMFKALSEVSSKQGDHASIEDIEAQTPQHGHHSPELSKPTFNFATVEKQTEAPGPPVQQLDPGASRHTANERHREEDDEEAARLEDQTDPRNKHLSVESREWMLQRDRRKSAVDKNGTSDTASE